MILFIARLISDIGNPILFFLPVPYLLVYKTSHNPYYSLQWAIFSFFFLAVVGLFVFFEVVQGKFTDLDISHREQRPRLFLFTGLIALLYIICLFILQGPFILFIVAFGIITSLFVVNLINTRVKASIHLATSTALISAMSILYGGWYLTLMLIIPLIAWSRIKTKRHTFTETVVGAIIGLSLMLTVYAVVEVYF